MIKNLFSRFRINLGWHLLFWMAILNCNVVFGQQGEHPDLYSNQDAVIRFNPALLDRTIHTTNLPVVVEFYAPWCGYCKRFSPAYKTVAEKLSRLEISVGAVNCDLEENKPICSKYEISGFPTIKIFKHLEPSTYNGQRTAKALVDEVLAELHQGNIKLLGSKGQATLETLFNSVDSYDSLPKAILVTEKPSTSLWNALSTKYEQNIEFAEVYGNKNAKKDDKKILERLCKAAKIDSKDLTIPAVFFVDPISDFSNLKKPSADEDELLSYRNVYLLEGKLNAENLREKFKKFISSYSPRLYNQYRIRSNEFYDLPKPGKASDTTPVFITSLQQLKELCLTEPALLRGLGPDGIPTPPPSFPLDTNSPCIVLFTSYNPEDPYSVEEHETALKVTERAAKVAGYPTQIYYLEDHPRELVESLGLPDQPPVLVVLDAVNWRVDQYLGVFDKDSVLKWLVGGNKQDSWSNTLSRKWVTVANKLRFVESGPWSRKAKKHEEL